MERGLLLPSIQIVNPANGTEVSYKVQYAPIYTGKAKSRPLSAYEEEIIKRALRSHSEGDDDAAAVYAEHGEVGGRTVDASSIDVMKFDTGSFAVSMGDIADSSLLSDDSIGRSHVAAVGSTQLAARTLLGKRQHQVPPTIFTSSGNDRTTVSSSRNVGIMNAINEVPAPPVAMGNEATHSESSMNTSGFNRPPLLGSVAEDFGEAASEDFIKLKLRHLKQAGSSKQRLRKVASGNGVAKPTSSLLPLHGSDVQLPEQRKSMTQKEQATELRRYQRRVIYMLNRVMTDAEAKQFEHFIKLHGLRPKEYPYK